MYPSKLQNFWMRKIESVSASIIIMAGILWYSIAWKINVHSYMGSREQCDEIILQSGDFSEGCRNTVHTNCFSCYWCLYLQASLLLIFLLLFLFLSMILCFFFISQGLLYPLCYLICSVTFLLRIKIYFPN